jgi:predicted Zn finger-like uncharacterized protein
VTAAGVPGAAVYNRRLMSLITRCPACGTMFKVVADQLKISEGWVRCGHCAEIFDAAADLRDETELALPATPLRESHGAPSPEPMDDSAHSSGFGHSVHSEVGDSLVEGAPDPTEIEEQVQVLMKHPLDQPFELRRADEADPERVGPHGFSRPAPLDPGPELHDLSFVRKARRKEFWRRPAVRVLLVLLLLSLAAALAVQVAYRDRDRLAVSSPVLRPWLVRMCDTMRCQLGPPQQIDSVGIETSSFNKLRGDTYRLNVTLRNQAPNEVAMPALELTLTDGQDQAIVRRVLQPAEFAPGRPSLAAGDWSTSVALSVNATAAASRVAGYRLLAFYP